MGQQAICFLLTEMCRENLWSASVGGEMLGFSAYRDEPLEIPMGVSVIRESQASAPGA